jgi:hypothetical protein
LADLDAFSVLMLTSLAAVPLALTCAGSSWAAPLRWDIDRGPPLFGSVRAQKTRMLARVFTDC